MSKYFAYFSLGMAVLSAAAMLQSQLKTPSTLDETAVWGEIQPVLNMLAMSTGAHVDLNLAQKVTSTAVQVIKDYVPAPKA